VGGLSYDLLKLVAELIVLWMSITFLIKWHKLCRAGPGWAARFRPFAFWQSSTDDCRSKFRIEGRFFNVLNHPNFGLPSAVLAGIPGKPSTQTGLGASTYTVSPPTGLLGVGLGADSSPRMIAIHVRLEF
jgi:hypothetical protein